MDRNRNRNRTGKICRFHLFEKVGTEVGSQKVSAQLTYYLREESLIYPASVQLFILETYWTSAL